MGKLEVKSARDISSHSSISMLSLRTKFARVGEELGLVSLVAFVVVAAGLKAGERSDVLIRLDRVYGELARWRTSVLFLRGDTATGRFEPVVVEE